MIDDASIQSLDRTQLKDLAYERLREAIVKGEIEPGGQLREAALATRLGVSKTPIREALVRLAEEGLVELRSFRGAVASTYDAATVTELFELRELVQGDCARRAARDLTDADLQRLTENVERSETAAKKGRLDDLAALLGTFDDLMLANQTNRLVLGLVDRLRAHTERLGLLTGRAPERLAESLQQHREILEALRSRDPDEAERVVRAHVRSVLAATLERMPPSPPADV